MAIVPHCVYYSSCIIFISEIIPSLYPSSYEILSYSGSLYFYIHFSSLEYSMKNSAGAVIGIALDI